MPDRPKWTSVLWPTLLLAYQLTRFERFWDGWFFKLVFIVTAL
jgi:hypothetical protein